MKFFDYPVGKQATPFDATSSDEYFAESGWFSRLGTFEEVGSLSSLFDDRNGILVGDRVLKVLRRVALVEAGSVVFEHAGARELAPYQPGVTESKPFVIYSNIIHEYGIDSWGSRPLKTHAIQSVDGTYNCSLNFMYFMSPDEAIQHAIELTTNKRQLCLVAQLLCKIDRG